MSAEKGFVMILVMRQQNHRYLIFYFAEPNASSTSTLAAPAVRV